jgi:hypothetical protein
MRTGPFPDDGRMPGEVDVRSSRGVRHATALLAAAGIAVAAGCAKENAPEAVGGPSDRAGTPVEAADLPVHVVAYGVCAIDWTIVGGAGAASTDGTQPRTSGGSSGRAGSMPADRVPTTVRTATANRAAGAEVPRPSS